MSDQQQAQQPLQPQKKPVRVYVDVVGDMFHYGHMEFFKKARQFGDYLIVGVCPDEACTSYKRKPILNMEERCRSIAGCRWVDEVYPNAPMQIDKETIEKLGIDIVVHGDDFDKEKLKKYYGVPMEMGIFRTVPYTEGISTTELIRRIAERAEEKKKQEQEQQQQQQQQQ